MTIMFGCCRNRLLLVVCLNNNCQMCTCISQPIHESTFVKSSHVEYFIGFVSMFSKKNGVCMQYFFDIHKYLNHDIRLLSKYLCSSIFQPKIAQRDESILNLIHGSFHEIYFFIFNTYYVC